ncbi:MAG TPA: SDR family oxidoreductase [Chthoniobacterales bacterium]|jgi:NAD(P)-dependent dehydrogenase (short-subunit alcohol dehydrogenase family)
MMLRNVVSLITGASQGLGKAIAEALIREGAHVAVCARDAHRINEVGQELQQCAVAGQKVLAVAADVSSPDDMARLFVAIDNDLGSIDVLVNNAGVQGPKGPSEEVALGQWLRAIEINLVGTFVPARYAIMRMKAKGRGKIINLSGGGATKPMPRISAYAASKAAVVRLTETLAEELRDYGIQVNAVAPGALNTRMLAEVLAAGPDLVGKKAYQEAMEQEHAGGASLKRAADLCAYLASAQSDGITGKLISAVWDPWDSFYGLIPELEKSDVYTLRRIVPADRGFDWR